jgi:hypothetical protein
VAPLEPWEKVIVDEAFAQTVHGSIACTECHNGNQAAGKDEAHQGLIAAPSTDPGSVCGQCHADVVAVYPDSLHSTQEGYWTVINERSVPENHEALEEMFGNHCAGCHTDCGDCHVSQPTSVGGGFIDGHLFNATPSLTRNCTACHGSRVGNEYLGKHEDLKADVHFRKGRMICTDCHGASELHGDYAALGMEEVPDHRYAGGQAPACENCHQVAETGAEYLVMHKVHGDVSCQVCHSVAYSSCDGCHVQVSEDTGKPYFATEGTYLTFVIGKNPLKSAERPYDYVTVRHVPIAETSYQYYGENLLPNFDALPTWVYATPHNIQRQTPQTESCDSCHENADIFLTKDKVSPNELDANQDVIVDETEVPELIMESFGESTP